MTNQTDAERVEVTPYQPHPCEHDAWPLQLSYAGQLQRIYPQAAPLSLEDFPTRGVFPDFAKFLPWVRTDTNRWQGERDWTLESGPDSAPSAVEIVVPYNYYGGCSDYFQFGCWNPGDDSECETGTAWFVDETGTYCEVNLLAAEQERVEQYICENPPSEDYDHD